jgi:hypothetical protein
MSRTYDNEKKPSQSTFSFKPTASFLQTRPFAPIQTDLDEDAAPRPSGYTENFLEKIINQRGTESSDTPVQPKRMNRLQTLQAKRMSMIQAKLSIGEPNDKYEQEADATASKVVQQINSPTQDKSVQREAAMEEEDELQMKPISSIQREAAMEEEDELQMKSLVQKSGNLDGGEASTDLESSIQSARGSGQSLDPNLQAKMGQAMGADFSDVKVHTDSQSDQLNQSIQAKAFTTGQDVFFRKGAYDPNSKGGQELIAHELTHVVQQNTGAIQKKADSKTSSIINKTQGLVGTHLQRKSNGVASVSPFYDLDGNGIYGADVPVNGDQVSALLKTIRKKSSDTSTPLNIKVLTGTHGSSTGHLVGEANFYKEDLGEEGNLSNTGWINVNNVITAGNKNTVTNWMDHGNRAVVLAWCYSSRSYANWSTRHCWKNESDAALGSSKQIW